MTYLQRTGYIWNQLSSLVKESCCYVCHMCKRKEDIDTETDPNHIESSRLVNQHLLMKNPDTISSYLELTTKKTI